MNDVRGILRNHESTMEQRNTVTVDFASIAQQSRRSRILTTTRMSAMAACLATAVGLGAWWGLTALATDDVPPMLSPEPVPSLTPTPSEEPVIVSLPGAPRTGPWAQYFVDAEYTDVESASGERWLTEPVWVEQPQWAHERFGGNWHLVGARDGNAILLSENDGAVHFLEVSQTGEPRFIEAAAPGSPEPYEPPTVPAGVVVDSTITYRSLTWLQSLDTPVGILTPYEEWVSWELPPGAELTFVRSEPAGELYEVRRSMPEHHWMWISEDPTRPPTPSFGAWDLDYAILRPYGGWVVFHAQAPNSPVETTNGLDTGCWAQPWSASMTLVTDVSDQYWASGSGSLLRPTPDNPVLAWWHAWHSARQEWGQMTLDEYRMLPGMLATPGIEQDSWIIWVNNEVSLRNSC